MKKILFIANLLCLFASYAFSLNLSDMRTMVRRNIRDWNNTTNSIVDNPRYSDAVINDLLNEGLVQVNNGTLLSHDNTSYTLVPGTSYYMVPNDFMKMDQVYFRRNTGEVILLPEILQSKLYISQPDWERSHGEPREYMITDSTFSLASSSVPKRLSYIPVPTNLSTGTVIFWYFTSITPMLNDSDIPFNGMEEMFPYSNMLVYYATMRIKMIEGIMDEAAAWQILYRDALTQYSNMFNNIQPDMRAVQPTNLLTNQSIPQQNQQATQGQ